MGFLDRFRKNQDQPEQPIQQQNNNKQEMIDVPIEITPDGKIMVEFFDYHPKPGQFYNVTRLILDGETKTIDGQKVYQGLVSWYGENDDVVEDKTTGKLVRPRAEAYKKVLFQIDEKAFLDENDPHYRYSVMKGLLNQSRVIRYLNNGLIDNPPKLCGNYIGGMYPYDTKLHIFDRDIGRIVHNSEEMKAIRKKIKEASISMQIPKPERPDGEPEL